MRNTPMKPRTKPMKKGGRIKPKKRSPASFTRVYGSEERAEWVKSLPCVGCGIVGYSENAHVGREGKGAGRKANADQITPLCGPHGNVIGCHRAFDRFLFPFDRASTRIPVIRSRIATEAAWIAHQENAA